MTNEIEARSKEERICRRSRIQEAIKILVLSIGAAVIYGIIHDQITARVCVEYFTVAHEPVFPTDNATILGFAWGIIATWWVGLLLGLPPAGVALFAKQLPLTARSLLRPVAILLACLGLAALVAGIVGYYGAQRGTVRVGFYNIFVGVPREKHPAFVAVMWAHWTSYNLGFCGAIVLWAWVLAKRLRLRFGIGERFVWCPVGAALAPFVPVSIAVVVGVVWRFGDFGWIGLAVFICSLAMGVVFVACLPLRVWLRVVLACLYLPVMFGSLAMHSFMFACQVSGVWP